MNDELQSAVRQLNDAWLAGRFDDLKHFFHPEVVLEHPGFKTRTVGRDPLIKSYADFAAQATIDSFETGEPQVDLSGDVAVTILPWRMKYQFGGNAFDESGWDILVWNRGEERWVVVWRTVILKP